MIKKFLIFTSFILFTYSLFVCVKEVESTSCSSCGDMSLQCVLAPGLNPGISESDNEWYWFNCGGVSYNQLKIRATRGGDYSLCKIEGQKPDQCPTMTDTCVGEGEALYLYQGSDQTYWILAHKNSGNPGFEIFLYCESGPPPSQTVTTSPAITTITHDDTDITQEKTSLKPTNTIWIIVLVVIVLAVIVFLYKFVKKKK